SPPRARPTPPRAGLLWGDGERVCPSLGSVLNRLKSLGCTVAQGAIEVVGEEKEEEEEERVDGDLEKERVLRTTRASRWRTVLLNRSTGTVSPLSFPPLRCLAPKITG